MKKIFLLGGTVEARILCEAYRDKPIEITAFVATEYGSALLPEGRRITVRQGRLDAEGFMGYMAAEKPQLFVDASHPYAQVVTYNAKAACEACAIPYLRLLREEGETDGVIRVASIEEAVDYLNRHGGNVLLTTGSKDLHRFREVADYTGRLYARVLPQQEALAQCVALGLKGRQIICMQGPFSTALNEAMIASLDIRYMVSKESGLEGGFPQKVESCRNRGIDLIAIGRPVAETGAGMASVMAVLDAFIKEDAGE